MKNLILKLVLTVVTLITSVNVSIAYDFEYDEIYYYILSEEDGTACVADNYGNSNAIGHITIPSEVQHNNKAYKVTEIGSYAFCDCTKIYSIKIPNSVTSIGELAFSGSKNLSTINIPNSIINIGRNAFTRCPNLVSLNVDKDNPNYTSEDGILYSKDKSLLIAYPSAQNSITIPNHVTKIGDFAFYKCNEITSVTIPSSVLSIGEEAFSMCNGLSSITIPNSVENIGEGAFGACDGLRSAYIGSAFIGYMAFAECENLNSVTLGESVKNIENGVFDYSGRIKSIYCLATIPPEAENIGNNIYSKCKLYVPEASFELYKSKSPWRKFYTIETV